MKGRSRKGKVEVVIMRKRQVQSYETDKKIFEVLIVKWIVKVRILGNKCLFYCLFTQLDTPIFQLFLSNRHCYISLHNTKTAT